MFLYAKFVLQIYNKFGSLTCIYNTYFVIDVNMVIKKMLLKNSHFFCISENTEC